MQPMQYFTRLLPAAAAMALIATGAVAEGLPGEGKRIRMARATWDTGWFQTEVYKKAVEALGYEVRRVTTLDNPAFYQSLGQGDLDFWVNGWFPLHDTYREAFEKGAETIGYVAKGGALQGYLIDKKSADKYGITNLSDFRNKEIRELFDSDGDGKAEMVACPPGWGCENQIAEHLDRFKLRNFIDPIKASYAASMADAIGRYKEGKSILFYTWTPNWTVGILKPGEDVVWIETPEAKARETVTGVAGCVKDPCRMGWVANDIRPVANTKFLQENPAIRRLLVNMKIPLSDIFAQNAKMNAGEDDPEDISRHAEAWIQANRDEFHNWIKKAKEASTSR